MLRGCPALWNADRVPGVQAVERAFAILRCLAGGSAGVTEVAAQVELPMSTVSRLPSTLQGSGQSSAGGLVVAAMHAHGPLVPLPRQRLVRRDRHRRRGTAERISARLAGQVRNMTWALEST